jgi:tetratricopeptide (TPR) repeat protein
MEFKNPIQKVPLRQHAFGNFKNNSSAVGEGLAVRVEHGNSGHIQQPVQYQAQHQAQHQVQHQNKQQGQNVTIKVLDFVISLSFGALFLGLPLFFLNNTFQGIIFEKQMYFYSWVLIAVISWATRGVLTGELKIKKTPLDYFIWAFVVAYGLATIFSLDRWHSFLGFFGDPSRGLINVLAIVLVYYFIFSNFTKQRLIISFGSIIAGAMVVQAWTMAVLFLATKFPTWFIASHIPTNLFGSVTSLGLFLSFIYPLFILAIYKLVESDFSKKLKISLISLVGFFFLVNLILMWFLYPFIFMAGIFPGVIVGISFFVIFVIALIVRPKEGWAWVAFFSFMAVLLLLMVSGQGGQGGSGYLPQALPIEINPVYPGYSASWDIAKGGLKEKFFVGTGAGSYGYNFSKFRPQELNNNALFDLNLPQGAGLFFEALPTIGFLGTTAGILILLVYLGTSIYLLSKEKEKNKLYSLGLFSSGLIFLYSALIMRVDGTILVFGILILILALATLQLESGEEERYRVLSLKASPKYALALAFIFMLALGGVMYVFVFMGKILVADVYMKQGAISTTHTQDSSIIPMSKAINLYPTEAGYYTRFGQEYRILFNAEVLKAKDQQNTQAIQQYLDGAIKSSNVAKELAPNDVNTVDGLAQVYENSIMFVDKSADLAEQYYNRALELKPHSPVYYLKLGQLKIAKASATQDKDQRKQLITDSIGLFQKAVAEKADYAPGYYYLAIAQEANGDLDKAIEAINNAVLSDRANADYILVLGNFYRERGGNNGEDYANAEEVYKFIISKDDKQYNAHIALGILYEKQKKNDAAIAEYKKVLSILPDGSDEVKTQLNKMISNVQSGTGNLQTAQPAPAPAPTPTPAPVAAPSIEMPVTPNEAPQPVNGGNQ